MSAALSDLGAAAPAYINSGLGIIALAARSKVPLKGSHGALDAIVDPEEAARIWGERPALNIGAPVPAGVVVIDVDPRHGGDVSLRRLTDEHGPLPATLTALTGGNDGGRHIWFRHPGGKLRTAGRPELTGIDLRVAGHYVVLPPSRHPDGGTYSWCDTSAPVAPLPDWLVEVLRPPVVAHTPRPARPASTNVDSIADWFVAITGWVDVLAPYGWEALDAEGTRWRHPNATSALSATIRNDCLFVYSTNTPFEPTGCGDCHGYTRFRAWAVLEHGGNLSAAARAARQLRNEST